MCSQPQAGFLTCALPKGPFPSVHSGQWLNAYRISDLQIGTDAHSGATVAALNRVPVCLSKKIIFGPAVRLCPFQRAIIRPFNRLPHNLQVKENYFSAIIKFFT